MKISTFNIKNDFDKYDYSKSKKIYNYLINNNIDILGLQEVFTKCDKDIFNLIKNDFSMVGKYRFLLKILHRKSNEMTPIITKYRVLNSKTYHLPHKIFHLKRVMTHINVKYNNEIISVYNTHLEAYIDSIKEKQLYKIYKIISKDKNKIILMGDFNLKPDNIIFKGFIDKLEKLNIYRINNDEKTFKFRDKEIDHIFISKEFRLKSNEVIKNLDISDHYPVMIDIK